MEIWIHRNGQFARRLSESAIRNKIADGSFSPTDLAWNEAKSSWIPISEFLAALPAASSGAASENPAATEKKSAAATEAEPPSHAAHRAAATEELKPAESPRVTPPPLPSMPMPAAGPLRA